MSEQASLSLFRKPGCGEVEDFSAIGATCRFDLVNEGDSHLMVIFPSHEAARVTPSVVRLAPGARQSAVLEKRGGEQSLTLSYAVAESPKPFTTHAHRYRAFSDGETILCVPVKATDYEALMKRTVALARDSMEEVTDPGMPPGTRIYTPGPYYKTAGLFARDFLYQLEGSGRETVSAKEVRDAVDFIASKQLRENRTVKDYTYPKGSVPDHVYPDGRFSWGPGLFYGDDPAHFQRPSMDEAMCFITLGWYYGFLAQWDKSWRNWFAGMAPRFADAWNCVPRNPRTGLVTQWTTPGHVGANGIKETHGACVMWGFHDSYGFGGDDVGVSVLACNAAWSLADMHEQAGESASAKQWEDLGNAMRDSVRAVFHADGYLPWGVGKLAPTQASPDITGYAVWSGILTDEQADAASDWLARCYGADKETGGAADLFHMAAPFRGAVRMARRVEDASPGRHVWPDMPAGGQEWENLHFGYDAYQDGGYWYYKSLGIAAALWRKNPELAAEWVGNTYADLAQADELAPYERIDGFKPVNDRYKASVGSLMGMGIPGHLCSIYVKTNLNS